MKSKKEIADAIVALQNTKIMKDYYREEREEWMDELKECIPEMTAEEKLFKVFE